MKLINMGLAAVLSAMATVALADFTGPFVVKSNHSGFTPVEWSRTEVCEIHADKVVLTKGFGSIQTVETRKLDVTGDLAELVRQAAEETATEKDNYLCDGPSTYVVGRTAADEEGVVLFTTGGCGSPSKSRNGAAARILRDLVDSYCPKTYTAGINTDGE
jgi:hypothetical protein